MARKLDGKTAVGAWEGENILSIAQFGKESAQRVLSVADEMKKMAKTQGANDLLKGKLLANVFMEPSTRTSSSFQAAMKRLGGLVVLMPVDCIQERFENEGDYNAVKDSFRITLDTIKDAKSNMVIMHPLPRVGEIAEEVDNDPRAAYFRQMENGMYVRMALLALVLGKA
ncbi:hypothetical protein AM588_10011167 [Phytophthora nicotianae]|uniref:Aspartate/ornithine carbamoyltransferase carbamoyl-P binding domain-containing protein n=1 Tax=Phytophthora nicotianae TaxID=4792 RepID=A0A0W8DQB3_PHYNI|nr:hypothetical protein AM588_10011167 [Phytophthora nicotianae]